MNTASDTNSKQCLNATDTDSKQCFNTTIDDPALAREREIIHTKRSLLSTCMYLSMNSRIVSQRAVNVDSDSSGLRC